MTAKMRPNLGQPELERLAREWFRDELGALERRLAAMVVDDPDDMAGLLARAEDRMAGALDMLRRNDLGPALEVVDGLLGEDEGDGERDLAVMAIDDPERAALARLILRGFVELQRLRHARLNGDYAKPPVDPIFAAAIVETSAPSIPTPAPASTAPKASVAMAEFIADRQRRKLWSSSIQRQNSATYERFREFCRDLPVDRYARRDIARFVDAYSRLPANHAKGREYRGLTFEAIIAEAEKRKAKPVVEKTIARNLSALSAFFLWCVRQGTIDANPCTNVREPVNDKERVRTKQPPWLVEDLNWLFRSPGWMGYADKVNRHIPGTELDRDWFYWLPLIVLFTGSRPNEPAGLLLSDIREEHGVTYFDFNEREDRGLKTKAATRIVPVHPELVALGFLDYVAGLRKAKETQLFPTLKPGGSDKSWSWRPSREFGEYLAQFKKPRGPGSLGYRALRGTFRTALTEGEVHTEISRELIGHAQPGQDDRYINPLRLRKLSEAVAKVEFPGLNLDHLRPGASKAATKP